MSQVSTNRQEVNVDHVNALLQAISGKCTSCMKNRHFGWWDRTSKCIRKDPVYGLTS